jgi:uncharacterized membrane protein
MDPFTRTHYMEIDNGPGGYAYSTPYMTMHPDMNMHPEPRYITIQDRLVPEGEVAIQRGMLVEATDGPAGQVGELLLDETGRVTHILLMKGHGWGKREIAIPVSVIDRGVEDAILLKIDKAGIDQLPSLPVKRPWSQVFATDLELMVWTFKGKDEAREALERVKELTGRYAMGLLNATILVKDEKGELNVHEEKEVSSKGRVALGVALGSLAGLVIGPMALVAGAIGGGVAGKKSSKKVEVGFSEEKLRRLNESLAPGGSALLLLVEHRWFHTLQVEMSDSVGQLIHERLSDLSYDDLIQKLASQEEDS